MSARATASVLALAATLALLIAAGVRAQSAPAPANELRTALVIGNASYETAPLRNPRNDAEDMAKTLRALGFQVKMVQDATLRQMIEAINAFGDEIKKGGVGLFYFAGHGVQSKGRNFLIPVKVTLAKEADLEFEAVDVGRVLGAMDEAGNRVNLVILDACRDNPFNRVVKAPARGLAQIEAAQGTYIAFATSPGLVALDGTGRNGLYTGALLSNLNSGDSDIDKVFRRVNRDVAEMTRNKQVPWVSSSLNSDFQFRLPQIATAKPAVPVPAPAGPAPAPTPSGARGTPDLSEHDRAFWDQVKDSKNPDELSAYLEQYPKGLYAPLARARLRALTEAKAPPAVAVATPPASPAPAAPAKAPPSAPAKVLTPLPPLPNWPSVPLNVTTLPFLSDGAKRRVEQEFVVEAKPQRVLAITEAGGWGIGINKTTLDDARAVALSNCQTRNPRHPCFIAAINEGSVVQASYSTQSVRDAAIEIIKRVSLELEVYGNEDRDGGVAPTLTRHEGSPHGATPRSHPRAKTITTRQLIDLYRAPKPPALINVLEWTEGSYALPGTSWIHGMGRSDLSRAEITELRRLLAQVAPDTASPLVIYCLSWECWMSYNAVLTASEIGYTNVYWYRGGTTAWAQAKLPVVRTKLLKDL